MNTDPRYRLAVLVSHPIQYQTPLYRALAARPEIDLTVYFCSEWGVQEYTDPGFGTRFRWDVPLLDGYRYCFLPNWSFSPSPGRFWGLLNPGIVSELSRQKFDAVMIHGYALAANWMGYLGAWVSKTPVLFRGETVLRPHRPWWIRGAKRILLSFLFRRTDAFLTIGSRSREFYESFGIPAHRMFFSPYAVDNDFFSQRSAKWKVKQEELKRSMSLDGLPVILFVGKIVERKRPFDLLYAYENIERPAGLVFIGDGVLRPELEAYVRKRRLSRVVFAGFVNQSELPKYYALADIFVLPSGADEVSPLVVNEAMCCGLPIVVSDAIPSCWDFVKNGYNGFIFRAGNVAALQNLLDCLIRNSEMRSAMGIRSQEIIAKWSITDAADGIVVAVQSVAQRRVA